MDTDEYEISITREIKVCKDFIKKTHETIEKFEKKYELSTENMINGKTGDKNISQSDIKKWTDSHNILKDWEYKLAEYEKAYHQFRKKS